MHPLNNIWRAAFGQDISNFEEMLIDRGTRFMKPEEPLFIVYMMMVRVLHQSQGEMEKALLQFAPQLTWEARNLLDSVKAMNSEIAEFVLRSDQIRQALERLEQKVCWSDHMGVRFFNWALENAGPVILTLLVFVFCSGFVIASFIYTR